jgi:hypothetical protein
MNSCEEHLIEYERTKVFPNPLWTHALDVLKHVLKGDHKATFFKHNGSERHFLEELQSYLDGKPKEVDSFLEAKHNAFVQERRWKRFDSECGDLSVNRLLDGEPRPFDDYRKTFVPKPAITIIMDMTVPYGERDGKSVAQRHEQIYKYACEANKEGRPCRVIAAEKCDITEAAGHKSFIILKDFDDPIFPSIWAAFENNRLANSFINAYMDYFIGTHHYGNGTCMSYDLAEDFDENAILVNPSTWIKDSRAISRSKDERRT